MDSIGSWLVQSRIIEEVTLRTRSWWLVKGGNSRSDDGMPERTVGRTVDVRMSG
jgi:hypothetical protein